MKADDLTGMKFGQLTVIERVGTSKGGKPLWLCRCDCGREVIVRAADLKNGKQFSCGCGHTKHGMTGTKIYKTWQDMMSRCYNPNNHAFDRYGGRGIKVCERWHKFENFYADVSQMENFNRAGYTLDRIDVNGDYTPENCRWVDWKTQNRNRRNNIKIEYDGVEMTLMEAAERSGISYRTLQSRYKRGDRGERLFRPVKK